MLQFMSLSTDLIMVVLTELTGEIAAPHQRMLDP